MTLNQGQAPPPWVCLLVALAGVPVGLLMSRRLVTGGYRLDDELGQPPPTVGWLVAAVVPALWGVLAWRVGGLSRGAVLPAYLLLAAVGVALFWVDVDVHRLPEALTLPCLPAVALLLAIASATTGDWGALARAVACGVAAWVAYVILALAVPGGLGLGDATLGASCRWRWATSPGGRRSSRSSRPTSSPAPPRWSGWRCAGCISRATSPSGRTSCWGPSSRSSSGSRLPERARTRERIGTCCVG